MNLQLFDSIFNYIRDDKNLIEVNLYQDDESYTIEYYLAGINKKDIELYHDNDTITLEITNHEFPTLEVIRREFKGYIPNRSITLTNACFDDVKTSYYNGKLVVNVPKKKKCQKNNNLIEID